MVVDHQLSDQYQVAFDALTAQEFEVPPFDNARFDYARSLAHLAYNAPLQTRAGRAAKFNGKKSHDRDGRVVSYSWRFGDGGTATGAAPKHVHGRAGTYTVKLTVTDDSGRKATAKKTVTVARR